MDVCVCVSTQCGIVVSFFLFNVEISMRFIAQKIIYVYQGECVAEASSFSQLFRKKNSSFFSR